MVNAYRIAAPVEESPLVQKALSLAKSIYDIPKRWFSLDVTPIHRELLIFLKAGKFEEQYHCHFDEYSRGGHSYCHTYYAQNNSVVLAEFKTAIFDQKDFFGHSNFNQRCKGINL